VLPARNTTLTAIARAATFAPKSTRKQGLKKLQLLILVVKMNFVVTDSQNLQNGLQGISK